LLDVADRNLKHLGHVHRRFVHDRTDQRLLTDHECQTGQLAVRPRQHRDLPILPRNREPAERRIVRGEHRPGEDGQALIGRVRPLQQVVLQPRPHLLAAVEQLVLRTAIGEMKRVVVGGFGHLNAGAPGGIEPPHQVP
jgi:hypothetical protein